MSNKVSKFIGDILVNAGLRYNRAYMQEKDVNKVNSVIIPDSCLLGIEFEWEGTGSTVHRVLEVHPQLGPYWMPTQDRSLRGDDAIEFKTLGPLAQPQIMPAIDGMMQASRRWKASKRTGLHVHMNAGDMTYRQWSNFVSLYALFEPCIFQAAGDERSANPFTVPLYKDGWVTGQITKALEHSDNLIPALREHVNKYCGLNLASLFTYGTMEFRHLRTTHDKEKVYAWINMILLLRRFALRDDFEKLFTAHLSTQDYLGLLAHVYDGYPIWQALVYNDMKEEIEYLGLDLAYEFFFSREVVRKEKKGKKKVTIDEAIQPALRPAVQFYRANEMIFNAEARPGDLFIIDDPLNQVNRP